MKVKIRTLKQEKYEVEVEPSFTIEKLKEIIEEKHKYEKSTQTLIYAGKILANEKTIEECNLKQEDFLVLMTKKATTTTSKSAAPEKPTESVVSPQTSSEKTSIPSSQSQTLSESDEKKASETLLTSGPELEAAILRIIDMGFSRDQVTAALKASFNNPERAVDYLMNGFPSSDLSLPSRPTPTGPTSPLTPTTPSSPLIRSPPSGQTGSVFDGLRQHPQFAQLCVLAQQGGEDALKQILQYFNQTNRPLLDLIMQNQDEFIRLLNTPVRGAPPMGPQGGASPGVIRVHVTPEDEAIINNLVGMGFERNRVLEAYFLFEKDETMTANYLLNNPEGDGSGNLGSQ